MSPCDLSLINICRAVLIFVKEILQVLDASSKDCCFAHEEGKDKHPHSLINKF